MICLSHKVRNEIIENLLQCGETEVEVLEYITGIPPTDGHRFEQCPILDDTDLIRENYKDFCKLIMRSRRLHNSTPPIKGAHAISFDNVDAESDESAKIDHDNISPTGSQSSDFHQGHP